MAPSDTRVFLVANLAPGHMGAHFAAAARNSGIEVDFADMRDAWAGPSLLRRLSHRFGRNRPTALGHFSRRVERECKASSVLLSTGISPLDARALANLRARGVRCINFQTDDPWNRANGAQFFWSALREYATIFSPRSATVPDLRAHGCREVRYLPCAYNPEIHYPIDRLTDEERARFECDVAFIGGADADRVALVQPLLASELQTNLYGGIWDRHACARAHYRGIVYGRDLRAAVASAKVHICMGRAANRDGHAMRTFELPAMRACLLVEDTQEHRQIFGTDDECVAYYTTPEELVMAARALCADPTRRERLAAAAYARITNGEHTYAARLRSMLQG